MTALDLMTELSRLVPRTFVIGYSGSGKSTLAKELGIRLARPVYALDDDPRWWDMIANDPSHEHLTLFSPAWHSCMHLMQRITEEHLQKITGPAIIEGCQLFAIHPSMLQGLKILMTTPDNVICTWREKRPIHAEIGTNADATKGGTELSMKLIEADRPLYNTFSSSRDVFRYNPVTQSISWTG